LEQNVVLHRKTISDSLANQDEGSEVVFEGAAQPLRLELEHFLHCCDTGETPIADGQNGIEVIRVLESAS
jgi:predicted dehydrogenase